MAMDWGQLLNTRRFKPSTGDSKVSKDKRSEFDRDFDRVIYSTPFRRLQDKTQVFPLEPNDSVRTRLTHSLEVSHAARGAAKDVCKWLLKKGHIDASKAADIETIAATCGLIHDLGNPPFEHSGELAIREWFADKKGLLKGLNEQQTADFRIFEGNAHTLRLVTRLQILADFYGLNLTFGTLSAACKYIAAAHEVDRKVNERKKPGFFASEADLVAKLQARTGTGPVRNPIAFLVEAADDAVYNAVDLEDGLKKGIIDWALIREELKAGASGDELVASTIAWAEKRVKNAPVKLYGREKDNALVQYLRVRLIGNIVTKAAEAFIENYDAIMAGEFHDSLVEASGAAGLLKSCTKLNRARVYCSDETLRLELMGRRIIWDLMDVFLEGATDTDEKHTPSEFPGKIYNLLSGNYRRAFREALRLGRLPKQYCQLQLVTDYVCGMTDTFAAELHQRLSNG